ncbi:MAG: hypothetical protein QG622_3167 [Actinomycetota bacterium]|nr:hypothetical protein [Actinomycetota bacterium]
MVAQQPSAGRPRLAARQRHGTSARDEILDAAAELFSERGYAATSTRAVALAVGIRQASLYCHFATKEQILLDLLGMTVLPSLDAAAALAERAGPVEAKLWALAAFDVRSLCSTRWNLGALQLLPELRSPRFSLFHEQRRRLREAYTSLVADGTRSGAFPVPDEQVATDLVLGLVRSVITIRQDRGALDPEVHSPTIADGCLRLLAYPPRRASSAARHGDRLLSLLPFQPPDTGY